MHARTTSCSQPREVQDIVVVRRTVPPVLRALVFEEEALLGWPSDITIQAWDWPGLLFFLKGADFCCDPPGVSGDLLAVGRAPWQWLHPTSTFARGQYGPLRRCLGPKQAPQLLVQGLSSVYLQGAFPREGRLISLLL